ncbi:MAG: hypothetical protein S4CHLAM45_01760 [Chlamydiales bacterium]|nr:hypothetical protein [Chlamydiales bacterium]MCH9619495.1 hypothetical protein [Chlamydiales bacterium]MCH9622299.1 hypothetical protein [Chlamydiales bacterium]
MTLCIESSLDDIFTSIPTWHHSHNKTSSTYRLIEKLAKEEVRKTFSSSSIEERDFGPFGKLSFPYFEMGAINSLDLFGLDELIIFSFYLQNRNHYRKALDLGANIGLHSILLGKLGIEVHAYEPDPIHFKQLTSNLVHNKSTTVTTHQAAISNQTGKAHFTRVKGNTTSSHLTGAKNPYGELETFEVEVVDIREILEGVDLVKMDVEGQETKILHSLEEKHFLNTDWMLEVSTEENKKEVFEILKPLNIHAFSQKKNWEEVTCQEDIPATHREGSLFLTSKTEFPWHDKAG